MKQQELWSIGQIEDGGTLSLCSYRQNIPLETRSRLPKQFIVEWRFSEPLPDGLPSAAEHEQMVAFRDLIKNPLEAGGEGLLAIISTCNGYRELYFYCRDPKLLSDRFNEAVEGRELPVELHAGSDPEWNVYSQFTAPFMKPEVKATAKQRRTER